uniref:Uncharacterized protein n=1 Tax=Anguilla anguilla TaxID=7936 RepID=A0A0E9XY52_ANGAN
MDTYQAHSKEYAFRRDSICGILKPLYGWHD